MGCSIEDLKNVQIFSEFTETDLHRMTDYFALEEYGKGEVIIKEGSSGDAVFVVKSGILNIVKRSPVRGKEKIMDTLRVGDFFGEMHILDGEPRSAGVEALTDTRVLAMHRKDFNQLIEQHPDTALKLILKIARIVSKRLREANERIVTKEM